MAHTFKVGDIVRGNGGIRPKSPSDNNRGVRGTVVGVYAGYMEMVLTQHPNQNAIGWIMRVSPEYFDLDETPIAEPTSPISRVLYNPPATVVFWSDGSKTVAKCAPHEQYDREKGLAICCAKKLLGEGYADAFKEFREPVNRVLTRNEVCALKIGDAVWVEDISGLYKSDLHVAKWELICGKVLADADDKHYHIGAPGKRFGATWRAWLLPRKPTAAELAANPWKREETT